MKKVYETEVLGQLTKEQFEDLKLKFDNLEIFTEQNSMRRLSIQMTDYARHDLDTRIRVTNGRAEIMQKIGDWNAVSREELSVPLVADPENIFLHFQMLNNILAADSVQKNIIQMDNYIYLTDKFEIKLTHQYGQSDVYSFEVEVFDRNLEPRTVCSQFELTPDTEPKDANYWDAFNKRVNIEVRTLRAEQVLSIIKSHCAQ